MRNYVLCMVFAGFLMLAASCLGSGYPFTTVEETVEIGYHLEVAGTVDVRISDSFMGTVRTLVDSQQQDAGSYWAIWDLMDDNGSYPGDGLYTFEVYLDGERVIVSVLEVAKK